MLGLNIFDLVSYYAIKNNCWIVFINKDDFIPKTSKLFREGIHSTYEQSKWHSMELVIDIYDYIRFDTKEEAYKLFDIMNKEGLNNEVHAAIYSPDGIVDENI